MKVKIANTTSRGQITLPLQWRKKFDTNTFSLEMNEKNLIISPLQIEEPETVIFDSQRDTKGKSIDIDEFITALEKSL